MSSDKSSSVNTNLILAGLGGLVIGGIGGMAVANSSKSSNSTSTIAAAEFRNCSMAAALSDPNQNVPSGISRTLIVNAPMNATTSTEISGQLALAHLTLVPGAHTNWHVHPGLELGIVTAGSVVLYVLNPTSGDIIRKELTCGESGVFGRDQVHALANEGSSNCTITVLNIAPQGIPSATGTSLPTNATSGIAVCEKKCC